MQQAREASRLADIPGVAIYLATSWTWCIGMFLPVLLIRDFGAGSFLWFALPNCLGAAAMGWVMRRPGASESFVATHRAAVFAFTLVTVAFQAYFIGWMTVGLGVAGMGAVGLVAAATIHVTSRLTHGPDWLPAVLTYLLSLGCAAVMENAGLLALPTPDHGGNTAGMAAISAVCVMGFALCPYLDATFHAARRRVGSGGSIAAFALGFLVFFPLMIALTAMYSDAVLARLSAGGSPGDARSNIGFGALACHMVAQAAFTIHAHLGMAGRVSAGRLRSGGSTNGWLVATIVLASMVLGAVAKSLPDYGGLSGAEIIYRLFMAFYGLVFPAYLLVCARIGSANAGLRRRIVLLFCFAVGVAAPMYWMGFIERRTWWLVPGIVCVLGAAAAAWSGGRSSTSVTRP